MKFKIITLGCKVNTYESEYIKESLLKEGYTYNEAKTDIIIINTCSVTNMADSKSLKLVRRARRENPASLLVVCGCSSQNNPEKYQELGLDILIGNKNKSKIPELISSFLESREKYTYFTKNRNLEFEKMTVEKFTSHTRAFIKIQDGCNNFCSYCIIPFTRGTIRSKDFEETLAECRTLIANNHHEIVLTGIHTGSYNSGNHDLSDLLIELAKINGLDRIRISSIEITELDTKFLSVLKNTPKICNHLHIPLQSGSNHILKIMNRKYDLAYFEEKIATIRSIRPDISITTDCIVGHPYETDSDFEEYLNFCRHLKFSKIHVFPYSKRDGTKASLMPEVQAEIKKARAHQLLKLSEELEKDYATNFLNQELEVLTEEYYQDYTIGHTSNYLKIYILGTHLLNAKYNCLITSIEGTNLYAKISTCVSAEISL